MHKLRAELLSHVSSKKLANLAVRWVYLVITFVLAYSLTASFNFYIPVIIHALLFILFLYIGEYKTSATKLKYLFGATSFTIFYTTFIFYPSRYSDMNVAFYGFFLPMLYAKLLPDLISPVLIGLLLTSTFRFVTISGIANNVDIIRYSFGVIVTSICSSIIFQLIKYLIKERDKYRILSMTDSLTKVATLARTIEIGQQMLSSGNVITAIIVDIDGFKQINDTFGHASGDKVLIQISKLLSEEMKYHNSIVGRLGGDEFIVIIQYYKYQALAPITQTLQDLLENSLFVPDPKLDPVRISFSIGEANTFNHPTKDIEQLIHHADLDMYYNKQYNHHVVEELDLLNHLITARIRHNIRVISEKDVYTYVHSRYVAQYAMLLAKWLNLPPDTVEAIGVGGLLHDMGKIAIPNEILRKRGKLTDEEYEVIQEHVLYGVSFLQYSCADEITINGVLYHHERFDGKGYPYKISGKDTPLAGRIMQIADSYSAMTIRRVYKDPLTTEQAIEEIKRNSGSQFDPELVELFTTMLTQKTQSTI